MRKRILGKICKELSCLCAGHGKIEYRRGQVIIENA
jgi:hypothetical protein